MPVISSTHTVGSPQVDGRRRIVETHTLNVGSPVLFEYLAPFEFSDADYTVVRDARAVRISTSLADAEFDQIIAVDP